MTDRLKRSSNQIYDFLINQWNEIIKMLKKHQKQTLQLVELAFHFQHKYSSEIKVGRTSLGAQWLRIGLQCRDTIVTLAQEDPTCCGGN